MNKKRRYQNSRWWINKEVIIVHQNINKHKLFYHDMTIKVDEEKCIGCGSCEAVCPQVFKIKEGKAKVIAQKNIPCVKEAKNICPVDAISI